MSSEKIKSKDLSYDSTLPPFLQRLRAQNCGWEDTDRHEKQLARPRKAKNANEDDGPTVVDETGEAVSMEEYEKLAKANDNENATNVTGKTNLNAEPKASGALPTITGTETSEKRTDISISNGFSQKKRKAAKIVGGDKTADEGKQDDNSSDRTTKKAKKKARIKLTFNDDEEL